MVCINNRVSYLLLVLVSAKRLLRPLHLFMSASTLFVFRCLSQAAYLFDSHQL